MERNHCHWMIGLAACLGLPNLAMAEEEMMSGAKAIFDSGYGPQISASSEPAKTKLTSTRRTGAVTPRAANQGAAQNLASSDSSNREKYLGLSFWVLLTSPNGNTRQVSTSHPFQGGDRIRINFVSNAPGYLYLVNVGTTGRVSLLFPALGQDSYLEAHKTYSIPHDSFIRFDRNPGEEILKVAFSPTPINKLLNLNRGNTEALPSSGSLVTASDQREKVSYSCGSKDLMVDDAETFTRMSSTCGSKDLVVEDDPHSAQPASYAAAPLSALGQSAGGQAIFLDLKLQHFE